MNMARNVGDTDRTLRMIIGVMLLSLILTGISEWRWRGLIGLAPFVTGVAGYCPMYAIAGINTCE